MSKTQSLTSDSSLFIEQVMLAQQGSIAELTTLYQSESGEGEEEARLWLGQAYEQQQQLVEELHQEHAQGSARLKQDRCCL